VLLHTDIDILEQIIMDKFLPAIDGLVRGLTKVVGFVSQYHNAVAFGGLATAIGGGYAAKKIGGYALRQVGTQLGLRGAAVAGGEEAAVVGGEGAAVLGAEAGGVGVLALLSEILVPLLIIAGVVALIYAYVKNPVQFESRIDAVKKWIAEHVKKGLKELDGAPVQAAERKDVPRGRIGASPDLDRTGLLADAIEHTEGYYANGQKPNRGQKNNNPGNIEDGAFARAHGATGSDGRFAIFPDYNTGHAALMARLTSGSYQNLSVAQIVAHYLGQKNYRDPKPRLGRTKEGDSAGYMASITKRTGLGRGDYLDGHAALTNGRIGGEGALRGVTIDQKTDIHIHGVNDPHAAARSVAREQKHVNADMIRNASGGVSG
jgi:hypothetical protein